MYPLIFQTKFFTLQTIWIFIAIAIITGTYTVIKLSIQNSLKLQFLSSNAPKLIIWTIIGLRTIGIIENFRMYFYDLSLSGLLRFFFIWDGNLNLWGGAIAFFIYLYMICKKSDQNFWKWLDVLIPAGIMAIAITNIGAFFAGRNYGSPTSLPWGVNFASPVIRYTVPIHPTQIYAFLYATLIAIILISILSAKKTAIEEKTGILGLSGIIAYLFFRFMEDFLRGDDIIIIFNIRATKILIPMFIIFTGVIIYLRYNKLAEKSSPPITKKKNK